MIDAHYTKEIDALSVEEEENFHLAQCYMMRYE